MIDFLHEFDYKHIIIIIIIYSYSKSLGQWYSYLQVLIKAITKYLNTDHSLKLMTCPIFFVHI